MDHLFFSFDIPFESFSADHWWALATFFIFLSVIISISHKLSSARNLWLGRVISIFLSVTVLIFSWIHWRNGLFNYRVDLPLSICNLFALLAPLLFWQPHFKRFEVIYFLVICGTFQAMLLRCIMTSMVTANPLLGKLSRRTPPMLKASITSPS